MEDEIKKESKVKHHISNVHHNIKKTNGWQIATIILAVAFVVLVVMQFSGCSSKNAVAEDTVAFVNTYLIKTGTTTLKDISEESGLYKINIEYQGNEIPVYATKDGKNIILSGMGLINLDDFKTALAGQTTPTQTEIPKLAKAKVELFVMSYCPYGIQAMQAMAPVAKLLKNTEIIPRYVIYSDYAKNAGAQPLDYCFDKEEKYCSMHGAQEVHEDVRQMCIFNEQKDKFWDYVLKVSTDCTYKNVDICWENVAKAVKVDVTKVKSCYDKQATTLLAEQVTLNTKYGVQGSPTLIINGVDYSGSRTADGFKTAICDAYSTAPSECSGTVEVTGSATTTTPTASCG